MSLSTPRCMLNDGKENAPCVTDCVTEHRIDYCWIHYHRKPWNGGEGLWDEDVPSEDPAYSLPNGPQSSECSDIVSGGIHFTSQYKYYCGPVYGCPKGFGTDIFNKECSIPVSIGATIPCMISSSSAPQAELIDPSYNARQWLDDDAVPERTCAHWGKEFVWVNKRYCADKDWSGTRWVGNDWIRMCALASSQYIVTQDQIDGDQDRLRRLYMQLEEEDRMHGIAHLKKLKSQKTLTKMKHPKVLQSVHGKSKKKKKKLASAPTEEISATKGRFHGLQQPVHASWTHSVFPEGVSVKKSASPQQSATQTVSEHASKVTSHLKKARIEYVNENREYYGDETQQQTMQYLFNVEYLIIFVMIGLISICCLTIICIGVWTVFLASKLCSKSADNKKSINSFVERVSNEENHRLI